MILALVLEMLQRLLRLLEDLLAPIEQFEPEIFALPFVHERLFVGRTVNPHQVRGRFRDLAVFVGLFDRAAVFALYQLHESLLPPSREAPLAPRLISKVYDRGNNHPKPNI